MNGYRKCGTYIQWNVCHKKSETLPFAETWTDLETIVLSEVKQTEKDKCIITLICII